MKKINVLFIIFLICLLASCNSIRKYTGTKITKLTYITIDYNGGYTKKRVLDFNENKYYSNGYFSTNDNPELECKNIFTDEEEKVFIDSCYSFGLFDLKELYIETGIIDGGGWKLIFAYEDGVTKTSTGSNAVPTNIFNKCSTYFYDLCGEEVMGTLPRYYKYPPQISYSFSIGNASISNNGLARVVRADYKWNKSESLGNNLYLLVEADKDKNEFFKDYAYQLVLYTSNYDCNEKFNKIMVKQYDYNKNLSNEEIIYTGKWFKQIKLDLKLDKIYVYELKFKDGDFVQYTFSTYCPNS